MRDCDVDFTTHSRSSLALCAAVLCDSAGERLCGACGASGLAAATGAAHRLGERHRSGSQRHSCSI